MTSTTASLEGRASAVETLEGELSKEAVLRAQADQGLVSACSGEYPLWGNGNSSCVVSLL